MRAFFLARLFGQRFDVRALCSTGARASLKLNTHLPEVKADPLSILIPVAANCGAAICLSCLPPRASTLAVMGRRFFQANFRAQNWMAKLFRFSRPGHWILQHRTKSRPKHFGRFMLFRLDSKTASRPITDMDHSSTSVKNAVFAPETSLVSLSHGTGPRFYAYGFPNGTSSKETPPSLARCRACHPAAGTQVCAACRLAGRRDIRIARRGGL